MLDIPPMSTRRKYLKLTTMYNIVGSHSYFPPDIFVIQNFLYSSHYYADFIRAFAPTQYCIHPLSEV